MPEKVGFIVGNTHQKIPPNRAKKSRKGGRKTHDITIFLDVTSGSPDVIEKVTFDLGLNFEPHFFICNCPVPRKTDRGARVWRFSTRQQVSGTFQAKIKIRGTGGTSLVTTHSISLSSNSASSAHSEAAKTFVEARPLRPLKMLKLPPIAKFGIELELTSAMHLPPQDLAPLLGDCGINVICLEYGAGRSVSSQWKIVPDSSIQCNRSQPDCNKFELVSPPLTGGDGLSNVSRVLSKMASINPRLKVNKSMGFHVHVDVSALTTAQLVKVCQQFVKYEEVIDTFMPLSRRTGSAESNSFFRSNRASVAMALPNGDSGNNKQIHNKLAKCRDKIALAKLMNNSGRYYKLNLQNLVTQRQTTIEFRQHSGTMNYEKVAAWIRFCAVFCANSSKFQPPSVFKENTTFQTKFDALFQYVVKDRALREFYKQRRHKLATGNDDDCGCCAECAGN